MQKNINKGVVLAIPVVVASALMLMAPMLASAQSPHFISGSADTDNKGNLVCTFKEAGLGNLPTGTEVDITCSASASAEYQCVNRGGNNPQAENKHTETGTVTGTGSFPVGSNGQVKGSITVDAPGPGDFSCPNGQRLTLVSATYTDITVTGPEDSSRSLGSASFP